MLRVLIHEARPGMTLAMPLLHPTRGNVLLRAGYVLDRPVIMQLHRLSIREFWVEMPGTEQIKKFISAEVLAAQSEIIGEMANVFESVQTETDVRLNFGLYRRLLRDLIEGLVNEPLAASYIVELGGSESSQLRHAAEVCFTSILLGLKLQDYLIMQRPRLAPAHARNVVSLGLGAMLHDIGYKSLPQDVRERYLRTRDESDAEWQQHVTLGYHMVSGSIRSTAAAIVLHHHQHFDGSGFPAIPDGSGTPRLLSGEAIHVFARIVCVANHFDRLRHPLGERPVPRVRVLRRMLSQPLARRFDPVVLAALPQVVPAYPPGSIVGLSNGERAIVLEWRPEEPCRPVVRALPVEVSGDQYDDAREAGPLYDLGALPHLRIVEQDGVDVSQDNFTLADAAETEAAA